MANKLPHCTALHYWQWFILKKFLTAANGLIWWVNSRKKHSDQREDN